jgi:hypothetical protein
MRESSACVVPRSAREVNPATCAISAVSATTTIGGTAARQESREAASGDEELTGLRLERVDNELGTIRVLGKGGKELLVPIGSAALLALRRYLEAPGRTGAWCGLSRSRRPATPARRPSTRASAAWVREPGSAASVARSPARPQPALARGDPAVRQLRVMARPNSWLGRLESGPELRPSHHRHFPQPSCALWTDQAEEGSGCSITWMVYDR